MERAKGGNLLNESFFCVVTSYLKGFVTLIINTLRKLMFVHPKQNGDYKNYHSINWSCIM